MKYLNICLLAIIIINYVEGIVRISLSLGQNILFGLSWRYYKNIKKSKTYVIPLF
jgi:hypothetical protein